MITYLGEYHPWRQGQNPAFDEYSRKILDLKRGLHIDYFGDLLSQYVNAASVDVVCVVPSHKVDSDDLGMKKVAQYVAKKLQLKCGCHCLRRHTEIPKLATGGSRNIAVHLQSIHVDDPGTIRACRVLLIDDVVTTGNSLLACSQLLQNAGAVEVICYALACTK